MFQFETIHPASSHRARNALRTVAAFALLGVALGMGALAWMP